MKTYFLTAMLLGTLLFVGRAPAQEEKGRPAREGQANAAHLNGHWTIVYAEMDGKALHEKNVTDLTIHNSTLSYKQDGKQRSWRLTFLPGHNVWATEMTPSNNKEKGAEKQGNREKGAARPPVPGAVPGAVSEVRPLNTQPILQGVYIASSQYLCFGGHKVSLGRQGAPFAPGTPVPGIRPGVPGAVPGAAPAIPGNPAVIPGVQGQAQQNQARPADFVLILKKSKEKSESSR